MVKPTFIYSTSLTKSNVIRVDSSWKEMKELKRSLLMLKNLEFLLS